MFSLSCRLVKGEEEDKCKIVLAAIEAKLPYLHRLVCEPMGTYTYNIYRLDKATARYCH